MEHLVVVVTVVLASPHMWGRECVRALLTIASLDYLWSHVHVPVDIWYWLGKRPSLPPAYLGRSTGMKLNVRWVGKVKAQKSSNHTSFLMQLAIKWNFKGVEPVNDHR